MTSVHLSETHRVRIEQVLSEALPLQEIGSSKLHEAMRYSALAGGKRIRPSLVYASGHALNIPVSVLDRVAVAIECIHAYSLVHDDLPAMDDDDLRRGLPTAHKVYDEATAILSGDALQAYAFECLSEPIVELKPEQQLKLINLLSSASGSRGMVGGQAIDLASVGVALTESQLETMHAHKTGALINASVMMPSFCRDDVSAEQRASLNIYANAIGLAFQVQDDILDIESDTETLGKQQGSDLASNKPTYPSILGMAGAKQKLSSLHDEALTALSGFGSEADLLRNIARFIVKRIK